MEREKRIERAYEIAREGYTEIGVDTDLALDRLDHAPISLHCWQTDDVGGCEQSNAVLSDGGIQATGDYPGKATNLHEIRQDLESETELAAGFDVVLGVELNFSDKFYIDVGAKYIKAFNVPQQLGDDAETIYPQYFEFYAGFGLSFGFLQEQSSQ